MKKRKLIFWIIFSVVIVGIVLTVVFVTLFTNKSTESLAKTLNSYSTSDGYLSSESDRYTKTDSYLTNLETSLAETDYSSDVTLVTNLHNTYKAYAVVAEFFNNEMYFTQYTDTYKKNKGDAEKSLKNAQSNLDKFLEQVNRNSEAIGTVTFWQSVAWTNCKDLLSGCLSNTIDAFNKIATIYKASVSSKILNNDLTTAMFTGLDYVSGQAKSNWGETAGVGATVLSFAQSYFADDAIIINFTYLTDDDYISDDLLITVSSIKDIAQNGSESDNFKIFVGEV